jgi:hypothetical protein
MGLPARAVYLLLREAGVDFALPPLKPVVVPSA